MWSHNHDAGSYETLYEVDSSSGDVVMYWIMTGTHVAPDRQQYDEHTHQANMIPDVSISNQTWCKYFVSNRSLNKYSSISSKPSVRADYSS